MPELLDSNGKTSSVSVILVNWNGLNFITPLFDSLARQTHKPHEIWFFDNSSTDGSAEFVKTQYPDVNLVKFERNTGFSFPCNEGIRNSTGEYVMLLNLDVVLEDTFIEELVKALDKNQTVGWVSGRLLKLTESGKSDSQIDCLGHHINRRRQVTERDYSRPFEWKYYNEDQFVFGASACAALYRRTMLDDVKLAGEYLDEDFFAYFEDVDLDWRAQQRGWKCIYASKAIGYHMRGGSRLIKQTDIAACFLANRWLMLVKNDHLSHLLQDLIPFTISLAIDIRSYILKNPLSLLLAANRFARYLPKMLRKRRIIKSKKIVPSTYLRKLIR